jgi:hypothetical protein
MIIIPLVNLGNLIMRMPAEVISYRMCFKCGSGGICNDRLGSREIITPLNIHQIIRK